MSTLTVLVLLRLPASSAPPEVVRRWEARLGDGSFAVRQAASKELAGLATPPLLVGLSRSADPEVRHRAAGVSRQVFALATASLEPFPSLDSVW